MAGDRIQDHVRIAKNLVVPEPKDYPALGSQPVVSDSVIVILVVLFAIALHHHSVGQAGEVDNEPSYYYLPGESDNPADVAAVQPKALFRLPSSAPQFASAMLENPEVGLHPTNRATSSR